MEIIKSTLGFAAQIQKNGEIETLAASVLPNAPTVTAEGDVQNEPPAEGGVLWLVNARVFGASERHDFVQFDPSKTVRDEAGLAIAQGGYLTRDGQSHNF